MTNRALRASDYTASQLASLVYELCYGTVADEDSGERFDNLRGWLADQDLDDVTLGALADAWLGIEHETEARETDW
jgi:hypothetical protein